eukprot:1076655-Amphidinium_carterae.1
MTTRPDHRRGMALLTTFALFSETWELSCSGAGREMLYLQLPKDRVREAGQRRPIALVPQVYRLWSAACKQDVQQWRQVCRDRGEVPVGAGALDETFELAFNTEARNASRVLQAGVFLDCSKCYERVPLAA